VSWTSRIKAGAEEVRGRVNISHVIFAALIAGAVISLIAGAPAAGWSFAGAAIAWLLIVIEIGVRRENNRRNDGNRTL